MRRDDQTTIVNEVEHDVFIARLQAQRAGAANLNDVLAESIYHEQRRLEDDTSRSRHDDAAFWSQLLKQLRRGDEATSAQLLRQAISHYVREVRGHINDRVYRGMARLMPPALGLLLVGSSPKKLFTQSWRHGSLDNTIILQGNVDALRRLNEVGTVVLTPTHVSNLDSVVLAFAAYRLGLPPFVYGAGLNLFSNPLLALFMHNLGCYTVDRRKHDPLYKDVLKSYATALMAHGYNNLFFPGGTRGRSGALERHLKLGLLGTAPQAYVRNLQQSSQRPKLFIVPATLSYQLVLEAETLIDDFLKDVGKSRYIISDDEFARPHRVLDFLPHQQNLWVHGGSGSLPR